MTASVDFSKFKVRCSSIVKALAESRSSPTLTEKQKEELLDYRQRLDNGTGITEKQKQKMAELEVKESNGSKLILSTGYIEYLMEEYAWITEQMVPVDKETLETMEMRKGNLCETEGLDMLSRHDGVFYKVHKERIYNEYLSGEVDSYTGAKIYEALSIADIKNVWDYPGYLKKLYTGLANGQEEQVQGYMDITGAGEGFIVNVLCSAPEDIVMDKKYQLARKMNAISTDSHDPAFQESWKLIERSMKFDHMPLHKRVNKVKIERFTASQRDKLYDRVKMGRDFLHQHHEKFCAIW